MTYKLMIIIYCMLRVFYNYNIVNKSPNSLAALATCL